MGPKGGRPPGVRNSATAQAVEVRVEGPGDPIKKFSDARYTVNPKGQLIVETRKKGTAQTYQTVAIFNTSCWKMVRIYNPN